MEDNEEEGWSEDTLTCAKVMIFCCFIGICVAIIDLLICKSINKYADVCIILAAFVDIGICAHDIHNSHIANTNSKINLKKL